MRHVDDGGAKKIQRPLFLHQIESTDHELRASIQIRGEQEFSEKA